MELQDRNPVIFFFFSSTEHNNLGEFSLTSNRFINFLSTCTWFPFTSVNYLSTSKLVFNLRIEHYLTVAWPFCIIHQIKTEIKV